MDYSKEFIQLGELAIEVRQYRLLNENMITDPSEVSSAMVRYIFPDLSDSEIKDMIEALLSENYVIQVAGDDKLIFTEAFYEAYSSATVVIQRKASQN